MFKISEYLLLCPTEIARIMCSTTKTRTKSVYVGYLLFDRPMMLKLPHTLDMVWAHEMTRRDLSLIRDTFKGVSGD